MKFCLLSYLLAEYQNLYISTKAFHWMGISFMI